MRKKHIEELKKDNHQVWVDLYKNISQQMISWIILKYRDLNEKDAQDLLQESLLILRDRIQSPDFQLSTSLVNYLQVVIRNQARNLISKIRIRKYAQIDEMEAVRVEETPEHILINKEHYVYLHKCIGKLSEGYQEIIQLMLQGHNIEAIQKHLGHKNKDTTSSQIYKAKKALRKLMYLGDQNI